MSLRNPKKYLYDIIGFRNALVHGYATLNPETVWNVITDKLGMLLEQSRALI